MNAQQYDRSKVVQIVNSVITKMDSTSGDSLRALSTELQSLGNAIERIKSELAEARTGEVKDQDVPTATEELDAVVTAAKHATDSIMNSCDAISAAVAGTSAEAKVGEETTKIYEACSFQDITGQRIKKVVKVLHEVETKVGQLLHMLGHGDGARKELIARPVEDMRQGDDKLMNGPQLPTNAMSQEEIDKLLSSFD
ncbi:MAG TPA: protein phosphatase CheZ [Alphaproteobacteria bacterium]